MKKRNSSGILARERRKIIIPTCTSERRGHKLLGDPGACSPGNVLGFGISTL